MTDNFYSGIFDFVEDSSLRDMYIIAYLAITTTEMWGLLRSFTPDPRYGFMFSNNAQLDLINNTMIEQNNNIFQRHSGSSYSLTMRTMHEISKIGYESFKIKTINNS